MPGTGSRRAGRSTHKYLKTTFDALVPSGWAALSRVGSRALALAVVFLLAAPFLTSLPMLVYASQSALPPAPLHGYRLVGAAPQSLPVMVTLALPLRNVAALDSLVMQVSDPASPMYRHFLSQQQARSEFLPTAAFGSLVSYLNANGFKIVLTALDSEVVVQGTAAQFSSAFGGRIDTYTNGTYSYYASSGASSFQGAYVYSSNATFVYTKPAVLSTPRPDSNVTFTSSSFSAKQLQPVYNATSLYSQGYDGTGQTIGLLDFYGSPTIASDLALFDKTFGFPNATLNVIPVGPYDPNLGANIGWSTEVSLDVESSHAMAPASTIDLYVANGALPLSVPLAQIVQDDKVATLSQSFGIPEWYYSLTAFLGGPAFFALNALIPDQYYAFGSVEGISFLASSGDGGGSGFSSGPEGNVEYPASSPYVTSVGGTQTYFASSTDKGESFVQTAWSNIGFVPNLVNEGGGGGGVSILEPKPWYQSNQATPPSFPNGRMNPDLSLQAGVDPATMIVDSGQTVGSGGTSESSPLLAGLLTLVTQALGGQLGLINPFVYGVGNSPAEYAKGFNPITFGYTIPWRAAVGYNLATGWGAPNVGELTTLLNATSAQQELGITGEIFNNTGAGQADYTPGQQLTVDARITSSGVLVTSGSFTSDLQTLAGTSLPTPMTFDAVSGNWTGTITMGQESGIAYVYLSGSSSGGVPGEAMGTIFSGYLGSLTASLAPFLPYESWTWDTSNPLSLTVFTSDILGNPAPAGDVMMGVQPYSIASNTYSNMGSVTLTGAGTGIVDGYLSTPAPAGPVSLVLQGDTYGYAPTAYGIYLQSSYIYPDVAAEPGSVAPGQYLTVIANPIAPVNVYYEASYETGRTFGYDVSVGSNVTASLVGASGATVSSSNLIYQPCAQALRVCSGGADMIYGQLQVPSGTSPGLYTVMLHASYGSYTPGGNLTGSFYGQVWVSGPMIEPSVSLEPGLARLSNGPFTGGVQAGVSSEMFQGEQAHVVARIAYSNATTVTYGEFTAIIYPQSLADQYASFMHSEYAAGELVQLSYDPGSGTWVGNVTLPSSANQGSLAGLNVNSFDYSGPYDVYVTGITADGVPTTSALQAQQPFFIQPYVYMTGAVDSFSGGIQLAFNGATITAAGSLSGDIFLGYNTIKGGSVTITGSQIQGSLDIIGANVTLVGVSGGDINANDSTLTLKDSTVSSLNLVGTNVRLQDSSYGKVSPALPSISVGGLSKPIGTASNYNITASGLGLSPGSLSAWVDGVVASLKVNSTSDGLVAVGRIDATALNDGVHTITVTALQSDGLSSTFTASFGTDAHQLSLEKQTSTLFDVAYALAAVSVIALVVGILALRRKGSPASPQV